MAVVFLGLVAIVMIVAVVAGIIAGVNQARTPSASSRRPTYRGKKFKHPTKANDNPLPIDPRFYNIGSNTFHRSKECKSFSLLETWDAVTESEALQKGMIVCPLCRDPIVFVYPRGKVYHKTKFCSDSQSIPVQTSEANAIGRGLHRCNKCW